MTDSVTIYKYPLELVDVQDVEMPCFHEFLSVQNQNETICVWAVVDRDLPKVNKRFLIVGTGNDFPHDFVRNEWTFLGTAQMANGQLVWHVFVENGVRPL